MSEQKNRALGFVFDATKVAPATAPEPIPNGWYRCVIKDGEKTNNDGGTGVRVNLEFEVIDGPFKSRRAFDGLQIVHSNQQTAQIGAAQFSAICHAVQVFQVPSLDVLFNKPFLAKFDVEPGRWVDADNVTIDVPAGQSGPQGSKWYDAKNRFKGCKPDGAAPASPGAVPGAPQPAWAATPPASPAATPPPPFAVAGAPAAPVAPSASGKPAGKGKPGPKPKPAAAKPERKFYVGIDQPEFSEPIPESKLVEHLKAGMPPETPICLEGETDYKTAADYAIGAQPGAPLTPATPPAAVTPPPAPAPASAGGPAAPPPWGR